MQLDLGHLEVHNTFEWHGGGKEVPSAVHLDVLHAEVCHPERTGYTFQAQMN
jgi:vacuolar protein sorting-associated protein 13A/C